MWRVHGWGTSAALFFTTFLFCFPSRVYAHITEFTASSVQVRTYASLGYLTAERFESAFLKSLEKSPIFRSVQLMGRKNLPSDSDLEPQSDQLLHLLVYLSHPRFPKVVVTLKRNAPSRGMQTAVRITLDQPVALYHDHWNQQQEHFHSQLVSFYSEATSTKLESKFVIQDSRFETWVQGFMASFPHTLSITTQPILSAVRFFLTEFHERLDRAL